MREDVVPNQTADVIDLKTYRERKVEGTLAVGASEAFGHVFYNGQTPLSPFAMPVAFFVFWPTWVFTPHAPVLNKGGSGAA